MTKTTELSRVRITLHNFLLVNDNLVRSSILARHIDVLLQDIGMTRQNDHNIDKNGAPKRQKFNKIALCGSRVTDNTP